MTRIGVIGLGAIGRAVVEYVVADPAHELAFVRNRSLGDVDWADRRRVDVRVGSPTDDELDQAELVVEAAHPEVIVRDGERILRRCDLLVVSAGALAAQTVLAALTDIAIESGTRLVIPQGALVGVAAMVAQGQAWTRAQITMTKAPESLDPAPQGLTETTVLYEGAVGPLAKQYPRNVNAMVTFALATLGIQDTVATLICDPATPVGRIDVELEGDNGASLVIRKAQPMTGVSGSEMTYSIIRSVETATGTAKPGLCFV